MSLLAFASGFAKAAGAAALKEDDRRAELSKEAYVEAMKRRDAALKIAKEQQDEFKKQRDYIDTVKGMEVDGFVVSQAEAAELYKLTGGDATKVKDAVDSGAIKIRNTGTLSTVEGSTAWDYSPVATDTEDKETNFLFGSRAKAVDKKVQERMGDVEPVAGAPTFQTSGIQRGTISTVEDEGFKNPEYGYWTNEKGESVPGLRDDDGKRKIWSADKNTYVDAPASAVFEEEKKDPNMVEAMMTISKFVPNTVVKDAATLRTKAAAVNDMRQTYERMAPNALDPAVHSSLVTFAGDIGNFANREIGGIVAITSSDDTKRSTEYWQGVANQIETSLGEGGAQKAMTAARKAQLVEQQALQLALQLLAIEQPGGRYSDKDVDNAMKRTFPKSSESFLMQSKENMENAIANYENAAEQFMTGLESVRNIAAGGEGIDATSQNAATMLLKSYDPTATQELGMPSYLQEPTQDAKEEDLPEVTEMARLASVIDPGMSAYTTVTTPEGMELKVAVDFSKNKIFVVDPNTGKVGNSPLKAGTLLSNEQIRQLQKEVADRED
jgi:hypothetical protein